MTGAHGMGPLMHSFFTEDCNSGVRELLQAEIATRTSGSRYFTFNIHNVLIDVTRGTVTVEDELDPDAEESVPLSQFAEWLGRQS